MSASPLLIVTNEYRLFDVAGTELDARSRHHDIFLALRPYVIGKQQYNDDNRTAVQHALLYQTRGIHSRTEFELCRYGQIDEQGSVEKFAGIVPDLNAHFARHPQDGEGRRDIIRSFVERKVEAIKQFYGAAGKDRDDAPKFAHKSANQNESLARLTGSVTAEASMKKPYRSLPEWMQVLTGNIGAIVIMDTTEHLHNGTYGKVRQQVNPFLTNEPFVIKMSPHDFLLETATRREMGKTLREELFHLLQARAVRNADFDSPLDSWQPEAEKLMARIDADPAGSETLRLIRHTDKDGGSLMLKSLATHPETRASELLVDLFDAEIFLRHERKLGSCDTEAKLREAFGDNCYTISRDFLREWIDEAATLKSQEPGAQAADYYRERWQADPFSSPGHHIAQSPHSPSQAPYPGLG